MRKAQIPSLRNADFPVLNLEFGISYFEISKFMAWNLEFEHWNLRFASWNTKTYPRAQY